MKKLFGVLAVLFLFVFNVCAETKVYTVRDSKNHENYIYHSTDLNLTYYCDSWTEGFTKLVIAFGNKYHIIEDNDSLHPDVKNVLFDYADRTGLTEKENIICWTFVLDNTIPCVVANWRNKKGNYTTIIWELRPVF